MKSEKRKSLRFSKFSFRRSTTRISVCPRPFKARMRLLPMNPAPPVTIHMVMTVPFDRLLGVKSRKAQHRGHRESQRLTEKSTCAFRPPCPFRVHQILCDLRGFLSVLCVKFRKVQSKICAPCKHFDG